MLAAVLFLSSCTSRRVTTQVEPRSTDQVSEQETDQDPPLTDEEFRVAIARILESDGGLSRLEELDALLARYVETREDEGKTGHDLFLNIPEDEELPEADPEPIIVTNDNCEPDGVHYDVPVVYNEHVERYLSYYQGRRRRSIQWALNRSGRYTPMMKEILRAHGVPEDLWCLVIIESAFKPRITSPARARGLWQFIPSTGRAYGLNIDWWQDERCDPRKATEAAARYLGDLYARFGCWYLSLASYNCGEGRVMRAMRRHRTNDYWELIRRRALPRETRNYVPAFIAAVIVAHSPERFGVTLDEMEPPLEYDIIRLDQSTDLKLVAKCVGTDFEVLRELNPELNQWCTPRSGDYTLRVPAGTQRRFYREYARIPKEERGTWHKYTVRRGDSLSKIAHRFGTNLKAVMAANNLRNPNVLSIGQNLIIPSGPRFTVVGEKKAGFTTVVAKTTQSAPKKTATAPRKAASAASAEPKATRTVVYRVRRGDTLSEIAERHQVSVRELMSWNGLRSAHVLSIGQRLKIARQSRPAVDGYVASAAPVAPSKVARTAVPDERNLDKVTYTVKRGDSLWKISQRFRVSVKNLKRWNGLRSNLLQIGQELVVYKR